MTENDKNKIFDMITKMGFIGGTVIFTGGNDEGGVESIMLRTNDSEKELKESEGARTIYDQQLKKYRKLGDETEEDILYELMSKPVYDEYGSFAGEFYVSGEIYFDCEKRTVLMTGNETIEEYISIDEEL